MSQIMTISIKFLTLFVMTVVNLFTQLINEICKIVVKI